MADPDYFTRPVITANPIFRLLQTYTKGNNVINCYKTKGYLLNTERNTLARIILDSALTNTLNRVERVEGSRKLKEWNILRSQYILWSKQIEQLFVGENCFTYYTPFRYINKEKINATGKLLKHHEYLLKTLRKAGTLAPSRPQDDAEIHEEIPAESEVSREWLKNNVGSEEEVKINWQTSFRARQEFAVDNQSISAYYNDLPCLATDLGAQLLKEDFRVLFPEAQNFEETWRRGVPILIQELSNCKRIPTDKRGLLESLPGLRRCNKDGIIAYLLPFVVEPPAPKRKLNEVKLTAQERQESFFIHVKREEDIIGVIDRHKLRLSALRSEFPPIPVFVGDIANLNAIYVYTNCLADPPTRYEAESVVEAIDLAFKSTFALQCDFQYRAKNVWLFIQQGFYGIKLSKDKCNQSVNMLLGQIGPLQENRNPNEF